MGIKRTVGIAAAAVAMTGVVAGGAALALDDDPRVAVDPVDVGVNVPAPEDSGATPPSGRQVAALDALQGTLEHRDVDADDFYVGAVELEFGPEQWLRTAGAPADYDGDGTAEKVLVELEGLVGQPVTVQVRLDDDGDDGDVYVLNDLTYRDSAGGLAPWQSQGAPVTDGASPEEVAAAAANAVGPGARIEDLDREDVGDVRWEAEVIDAAGRDHTVLLDASGAVLDARQDD